MDTQNTIQLFILFILLLLSAFFSSAETALTTVNKYRMRTLAEEGNKKAARVIAVTSNSGKMISAILIGNNIVNLSASSLATSLAIELFGSIGAGIATGILTLLILIFGEISPKTLATLHADSMALRYAGFIAFLMKILTPVIFIMNNLSMLFLRLLRVDPSAGQQQITENELRTIVDVGHEEGVLESEEHEIITNVFDFTDAQTKEVMIPRIDMTAISVDASYQEILEIYRETHYTRLPVYEESLDNIIGILNMKDLLLVEHHENLQIRDIMRDVFFTYEYKNTAELFSQMQSSSINIAIVLDEYGATAGLITMEDLLEEIVGEIHDEYDENEKENFYQIGEREYMVSGALNLDDLCDELNLQLESEDYDSIGGYVIEQLDHVPEEGDTITAPDGTILKVETMDKNRIEKLHLTLPEPTSAEEEVPEESDDSTELN